jgi:DnaJ-class molecular chaperone
MTRLEEYLEAVAARAAKSSYVASSAPADECGECNGTGTLTRLGGDWGKTPDTEVACWSCKGTGKTQEGIANGR